MFRKELYFQVVDFLLLIPYSGITKHPPRRPFLYTNRIKVWLHNESKTMALSWLIKVNYISRDSLLWKTDFNIGFNYSDERNFYCRDVGASANCTVMYNKSSAIHRLRIVIPWIKADELNQPQNNNMHFYTRSLPINQLGSLRVIFLKL